MDLSDVRSSNTYDLDAPYSSLTGRGASDGRQRGFVGYFNGRKGWWWIWGFVRVACLVVIIVFMALLLNNFYVNGGGHCSWCRYLRYTLGSLSQPALFLFGLFSLTLWLFLRWFWVVLWVLLSMTDDSCLPVNGWCDLGNIKTTTTNTPSRMLL